MTTSIDHQQLGLSRLATQFRESVNLIAYLTTLLREANDLEQVYQDLLNNRWVDTAVGVQLDIIGEIVGQPRELVDAVGFEYFGFDTAPASETFGDLNDAGVGERFISLGEPETGNRVLNDDEYRAFIRARIIKNSVVPTIQATIDAIKLILPDITTVTIVEDGTDMKATIDFGRTLTPNEEIFVTNTDLIPKPTGVEFEYINI